MISQNCKNVIRIKTIVILSVYLTVLLFIFAGCTKTSSNASKVYNTFPNDKAININPDTHLKLSFHSKPVLGDSGKIRIYDASANRLVDSLDLSIPPGPTIPNRERVPYTPEPYQYVSDNFTNANTIAGTPSGAALPTPSDYQLTIIGRFTDGFHFYPVIIHDSVATIYPHHNLLEYDKTYYVQIDPGVLKLQDSSFTGITGTDWTFSTKTTAPPLHSKTFVVAGDGSGDFNTIQGAIDFIPDDNPERVTLFIKNGSYEEIVCFRNKTNVTFLGEDRDKVLIRYANNEVFNPHPANIATNEWPGTFPSRRAAFMADNCKGIHLVNLTVESINEKPAQAEGLLLMGSENIVYNVNVIGSGDALQINGSVYLENTSVSGFGDNILGRGPSFFRNCELISSYGPHMWIRNTQANHGNIFLNCTLRMADSGQTTIARTSDNHGKGYPYAEAVLLNCALAGIRPGGWGIRGKETSNIHYWEYNSINLSDGKAVDTKQRHPLSRQLTMDKDDEIIANYSTPAYVLDGWTPLLEPLILAQPPTVKISDGGSAEFRVDYAAVPEPDIQWFRDGSILHGETKSVLVIKKAAENAKYTVRIMNDAGSVRSSEAQLIIE